MKIRTQKIETFKLVTLGCKVNQCESQLIREKLEAAGLREAGSREIAGLCVVNTCAVTSTAQGKSVRALRKCIRDNPGTVSVAVGCGVSASGKRYEEADFTVNQEDKEKAIELILGISSDIDITSWFEGHARAFLKIQDGCDSFCSYCIVPYLRGLPRSKRPEAVIREARKIAKRGYRELVLTGIHLGTYGKDFDEKLSLVNMLEILLKEDLFPRIRLSGVECSEADEGLISLMASDKALCHHFHIPLQSGSEKVLRDMNRHYSPDDYMSLIDRIRSKIPRVAITTDIIVGFPTETESNFEETLNLCREARFSRIHVFPYSRRAGTEAARLWKKGRSRIIKERASVLRSIAGELSWEYARSFEGKQVRVLLESREDPRGVFGYTDQYVRALVRDTNKSTGSLVSGKGEFSNDGLLTIADDDMNRECA